MRWKAWTAGAGYCCGQIWAFDPEMELVRCWSNVERVFEELGVTFQEVILDLELLGGKGWISKIWMQETEY